MGGGDLCCEENYVSRASTAAASVYVCAEERFHHAFPDATPFHPPPPFSLFVRKDLNLSERQEFESYDLYTTRSKDLFQHTFNMVGFFFCVHVPVFIKNPLLSGSVRPLQKIEHIVPLS